MVFDIVFLTFLFQKLFLFWCREAVSLLRCWYPSVFSTMRCILATFLAIRRICYVNDLVSFKVIILASKQIKMLNIVCTVWTKLHLLTCGKERMSCRTPTSTVIQKFRNSFQNSLIFHVKNWRGKLSLVHTRERFHRLTLTVNGYF